MAGGRKLTFKLFEEKCRRIIESTPVDTSETTEVRAARIARAKVDYEYFFEYYFPKYATSKCAWFHLFAAKLMMKHDTIRLMNEWFRGCAKSVHNNMGYPLWLMINGKLKCMAIVGANEDKACLLLSDIQAQLSNNLRFRQDFGEQMSYGNWEEGHFVTKDGVAFNAIGIGQSPRGLRVENNRPDYISIDDVDSQELSNNPKRVRKLVDWICDDLMGCFDVGAQRFVVNNNRPFVNSVLGSLIDEKLAGATKYPMSRLAKGVKAAGAIMYESIGFWHHLKVNAVDENFEPSWGEKYTKEYWLAMRADKSYRSWMREYMNTPIVEGTVFKNDWIQWREPLPLNEYDYLIAYCDPSWKGTAGSDHKAVVFIGKKGVEYHIIKVFNRVASIGTLVSYMYDLSESCDIHVKTPPYKFKMDAGAVVDFWIEATMNQDLHLEEFEREGDRRGYQLPIRPDYRSKPDKFSRIESISPFYERGWLYHNIHENENADMLRHIEHTLAFEQGSKTPDDSLDAEEGAIYYAQRSTRTANFKPIVGKRKLTNRY